MHKSESTTPTAQWVVHGAALMGLASFKTCSQQRGYICNTYMGMCVCVYIYENMKAFAFDNPQKEEKHSYVHTYICIVCGMLMLASLQPVCIHKSSDRGISGRKA